MSTPPAELPVPQPKPTTVSIAPGRPEPTLKLFRETFTHIVGDPVEGERIAWAVLRQWAGTVVRLPTLPDIERLARETAICQRLARDPGHASVRHVADHFSLQVRDSSRIVKQRTGIGVAQRRASRSDRPGLTCRTPRFNRHRQIVEC